MGIDKSNVSFVIHYNMPKSLEAYYQEAGRAGRDGEAAECILLYGPGDVATAQFFLQQAGENEDLSPEERAEVQARDARRLEAMVNYCKTTHCLRGHLLDYFGQAHDPTCGNCGNCRSQFVQVDITRQAQMILSCVKRVQGKLGYYVGADLLSKVLRGSRSPAGAHAGIGWADHLWPAAGHLGGLDTPLSGGAGGGGVSGYRACSQDPPAHSPGGGGPFPGEQGILNSAGGAGGVPSQGRGTGAVGTAAGGPGTDGGAEGHPGLQLARQEEVPLYVIFSNATLADMARRRPQTMEEFLSVSGVGEVKARKYGRGLSGRFGPAANEESDSMT